MHMEIQNSYRFFQGKIFFVVDVNSHMLYYSSCYYVVSFSYCTRSGSKALNSHANSWKKQHEKRFEYY